MEWYWLVTLTDLQTRRAGLSASAELLVCLAAPKSHLRLVGKVVTTSAGFPSSVSGWNATSGLVYTSGNAAKFRPPRTCDLRTMEVVAWQVIATYVTRGNSFHCTWNYTIELTRNDYSEGSFTAISCGNNSYFLQIRPKWRKESA